jgi:SAM-dependent methyltransferase
VALLGGDQVAAVDPSEPFAEACAARLPEVRVEVGAAESLPFADDEFDAALAQLVVNFMSDAAAGVREMRRVTRPGGTVAAAVWDYAGEMTILRRGERRIRRLRGPVAAARARRRTVRRLHRVAAGRPAGGAQGGVPGAARRG